MPLVSDLPKSITTQNKRSCFCSCAGPGLILLLIVGFILITYFLFPGQTDLLIIGIDYTEIGNLARSDTIIITRFNPPKPGVTMLSIPRDLWVPIPGIGENRINTAHFFGEANNPGSGPYIVMDTIQANFQFRPDYYIRIRFDSVREIVNAIGGIDIELTKPIAGYEPGIHHLTGNKALAFARHRLGSDDFYRMEQSQFILKSALNQVLLPRNWLKFPFVIYTILKSVDTNIPTWLLPRLGFTLIRVGPEGIENKIISREMVIPFTTTDGAQVLGPNWDLILPTVEALFP